MQIILIQDVEHLGSLGDELQVKDGYARNFLLPRGMAIVAGSRNSREIEHRRKRLEQLRSDAIEQAKTESDKVAALHLLVKAKAGANGKLFGSVTNRDLQAVLAEQGYQIDRRAILIHTPIKSVGTFTVTVKLHTAVKVEVGVTVEPITDTGTAGKEAEGEVLEGTSEEAAVGDGPGEEGAGAETTLDADGEQPVVDSESETGKDQPVDAAEQEGASTEEVGTGSEAGSAGEEEAATSEAADADGKN